MNYLLSGCESYNLRQRKNEIIGKILTLEQQQLALSSYRGDEDIDISQVIDDCQTVPFLVDKKVVVYENPAFIVNNKMNDKQLKQLIEYLKKPTEFTTLIFYVDGSLKKSGEIVKEVCKYLKYEVFEALSNEDFARLVSKDLKDNNIVIDKQCFDLLLQRLPVNVENWKRELEKIKLYPEKLDKQIIKDLVSKPLEDDVFALTNAVINNNMSEAIKVYRDLLINNKNDTMSLIGLLASQFRFMSQVKILQENNLTNNQIASRLSANEYRVKMTLKSCGRKDSGDIMAILNDLSQLDQDIKVGKIAPDTGLELFIIKTIKR